MNMHADEKSDKAIGAEKQPNNIGNSPPSSAFLSEVITLRGRPPQARLARGGYDSM